MSSVGQTSDDHRWHTARQRAILAAHPEIAKLYGSNAYTPLVHFGFIALHTVFFFGAGEMGLFWVVVAAAVFGACAEATMFGGCHEISHKLVTRSPFLNDVLLTLGSLVSTGRYSVYYRLSHLAHHRELGSKELTPGLPKGVNPFVDPDRVVLGRLFPAKDDALPPLRRLVAYHARIVRMYVWEGLVIGPSVTARHIFTGAVLRRHPLHPQHAYDAVCLLLKLALFVAAGFVAGPLAFVYIILSQLFFRGLFGHPFFALLLMFHDGHRVLKIKGATGSVYNWYVNWGAMNLGYHVEHHDFPQVPWNRLPQVRKLAPEFYVDTPQVGSPFDAVRHYFSTGEPEPVAEPGAAAV